jgi:hypothetical protein
VRPRRRRVTRAAIVKTIRATVEAGLTVARVITLSDGVSIETTDAPTADRPKDAHRPAIIL